MIDEVDIDLSQLVEAPFDECSRFACMAVVLKRRQRTQKHFTCGDPLLVTREPFERGGDVCLVEP